ncbi:unnamed protein product [Ceutorhynchus assimilis]|uniref:Peptidase S1 domain-containing protein n=1 Tax=Ceutorhynchus assimilis TaxID=467358 RepID=A0A9P0DN06_9CUCU|nr:unnamed protein product [Ceutorhynchus assimilis]
MLVRIITLYSLVISIVYGQVISQLKSPCPEVFKYEQRSAEQPDRWFGVVTVGTDEDLEGVWLKIVMDRKVDLLGNWFAEAVSKDNIEFSIRNSQYKLEAGPPVLIRFFVKYNVAGVVPTVKKILLNGKTICPIPRSEPTKPVLHITVEKPNTSSETSENYYNQPSHNYNDHSYNQNNEQSYNQNNQQSHNHNRETDVDNDRFPNSQEVSLSSKATTHRPMVTRTTDRPYSTSTQQSQNRPTPMPIPRRSAQCGTVLQRPTPLISHGQETTPGQWPWHVALYLNLARVATVTELKYTCGGTLISASHVITAAHCVTKQKSSAPARKEKLVIYLGKHNLENFGSEMQIRQIDEILVHPNFSSTTYYNDIAILKLNSPAEINDYVRPCCLWEGETNIERLVGQRGTVVGWGYNESGELSKNLMQTELPIVSTATCLFSNRNFFSQFMTNENFCVGFRNDTAVCNGDSGGGMVFKRPGTSGENTIWQLRGLVSLGVVKQTQTICDPKQYSIFTDVAKYLSWIKDNIY